MNIVLLEWHMNNNPPPPPKKNSLTRTTEATVVYISRYEAIKR